MNRDEIKKAWDCLTPDEEAKNRMLQGIMAKAAAMEQEESAKPEEKTPWYIRLRVPMGFSAAAMACAMVVTFAAGNSAIMNNGSSRQELLGTKPVSGMHTTDALAPAETTQTTTAASVEAIRTTAAIEAAKASFTTVTSALTEAPIDNTIITNSTETEAFVETKPIVSNVVTSPTSQMVTSSITTEGSVTTPAATTSETQAQTTVLTSDTTVKTTTVGTTASYPSLYGDMYDFNHVSWAGLNYDTAYETIEYMELENHLGSGIAVGDAVDGSYTILLYKVKDMPIEKGLAVQYAGQTEYYLFYCVG